MSTIERSPVISRDWNGTLMTPEEFDAALDWDESYRYELINGVLIVSPSPSEGERGPNEQLAYLLLRYQEDHPEGSCLKVTLPEHTLTTGEQRRRADRVIWCEPDQEPDVRRDVPSIVVEFVSADRRDRERDYETKRIEYAQIGVREYWIIDRFGRQMTAVSFGEAGDSERILEETETFTTPLLPGFELPLQRLFAVADRLTRRFPPEE